MLMLNGQEYRNLPGSDYYISQTGCLLRVTTVATNKKSVARLSKNNHRVYRNVTTLAKMLWP